MTLLNLQKSIYNIQKECFDRVNHYSIFVEMEWYIYVTREQEAAGLGGPHRWVHQHGKKMALDKNGRKQHDTLNTKNVIV